MVKKSSSSYSFVISINNLPTRAGYDTRSIFKRSLTGLSSEFSFSLTSCLTKTEEPSLPYYLPKVGGRIIGFLPFPRVLVLCEMQLAWSRIWTCVAVSISYDDNHYTTGSYSFLLAFFFLIYWPITVYTLVKLFFESFRWQYLTLSQKFEIKTQNNLKMIFFLDCWTYIL